MTGLVGADVRALERLAIAMRDSAGQLDRIRVGIRAQLYSVHWDGADGQQIRADWDRRLAPFLAAAAIGLRDNESALREQMTQQLEASGEQGGHASRWDGLLRRLAPSGVAATLGGLLDRYGSGVMKWTQHAHFLAGIPELLEYSRRLSRLNELRTAFGVGALPAAEWMSSVGVTWSKAAGGIALGAVLSVADVAVNWSTKGLYARETTESIGLGAGGIVASFVVPPLGGLAWTAGTTMGRWLTDGTKIDEKGAEAGFSVAYGDKELIVPERSRQCYHDATLDEKQAYAARQAAASAEANRIVERTQKPWLYAADYVSGAWRGWR